MADLENIIKVGMLVSYDWRLLKKSIPRIYEYSDIICLALDVNRISWSCNKFEFDDDEFYKWVREFDVDNKIKIYEDKFSITKNNARENCNRQRLMLSTCMGQGGWHIQIDADEYFVDFQNFVAYLLKYNSNPKPGDRAVNICANFVPLFKKLEDGFLYVDSSSVFFEKIPMATNRPQFIRARQNNHFNHITNFFVIHETWARGEEELRYKINNWGHSSEELEKKEIAISYLNLWKSLDKNNYKYVININPSKGNIWPKIDFFNGNIDEFISFVRNDERFNITKLRLFYYNNKNIARIRYYLNKFLNKK